MAETLSSLSDHYLVSANGRLGDPPRSAVSEVARILEKAAELAPENGLVIHFHGGLVPRQDALDNITAPLTTKYAEAKVYPLFFVWESGFTETLQNNKDDLLKDKAFRELVKKVSEWVLKRGALLGAAAVSGAPAQPLGDVDEFRKEFDRWFDGEREVPPCDDTEVSPRPAMAPAQVQAASGIAESKLAEDIEDGLPDDPQFREAMTATYKAAKQPEAVGGVSGVGSGAPVPPRRVLISREALDEMFPQGPEAAPGTSGTGGPSKGPLAWAHVAQFVAKLVTAVAKRFRENRDHGVYCTVVEEVLRGAYGDLLGAALWNQMKKDTLDSFTEAEDTCGLAVVKKLKELEEAGKGFKKLTLVGHSTGAIYICNFMDLAKTLGLGVPMKVVFLAPAVTCQRFAQAIDEHGASGLADFRMFAMRDEREIADEMLKPLYTRSLLYFVSGLLEGNPAGDGWDSVLDMPIVGMERFYEAEVFKTDVDVGKVLGFLEGASNRRVWSRAADQGLGLNSDSQKHGDFDSDASTLQSVVEFIQA